MNITDAKVKDLVAKRQAAEKAVEGVDPALKEKAFEIVFLHLLDARGLPARRNAPRRARGIGSEIATKPAAKKAKKPSGPKTLIAEFVREGFFDEPRTLTEVQDRLRDRGHHYKQSALSPALLSLTRSKTLRRERKKNGKRDVWIYKNYS